MLPWSAELSGRVDEHVLTSELLRDNPLGDPHERPLWVYVPPGYDDDPGRHYPAVYWVTSVAFGRLNGRPIAVSKGGDTVRVWDLLEHRQIGEPLTSPDTGFCEMAYGEIANRPIAVTTNCGGTGYFAVRQWDLAGHRQIGRLQSEQDYQRAFCRAGDRSIVITTTATSVRAWDLAGLRQIGAFPSVPADGILAVTCGQVDGRAVVITGGKDGAVRMWSLGSP